MVSNEEIKAEAKQIMDNFLDALSDIELEEDFILERDVCVREENSVVSADSYFKDRFLSNAPKTSGDAILANKGDWTKN